MSVNDLPTPPSEADNRTSLSAGSKAVYRGGKEAPAAPGSASAGAYAELVKDLLAAEERHVTAIETRAIAVITTSGALVTLLLGLAALVTRVQGNRLSGLELILAAVSVGFFLIAAFAAMWVNRPWKVWAPDVSKLAVEMWVRWGMGTPHDPVKKATATRIDLLHSARTLTQEKASALFVAVAAQAVAVTLVGVVALIVLI